MTLLMIGATCALGGEKKKLADMEFEFEGKQYSIVYSWEGRIKSNWSYLQDDTPPITFKTAKRLLEKEI